MSTGSAGIMSTGTAQIQTLDRQGIGQYLIFHAVIENMLNDTMCIDVRHYVYWHWPKSSMLAFFLACQVMQAVCK